MEDYYALLEVKQDASLKEIKLAYRKKIRKYHPDINKDKDAEKTAKLINKAYHILSDTLRREEYDLSFSIFGSPTRDRNINYSTPNTATWKSVTFNGTRTRGVKKKVRIETSDGYFDIEFS